MYIYVRLIYKYLWRHFFSNKDHGIIQSGVWGWGAGVVGGRGGWVVGWRGGWEDAWRGGVGGVEG